MGVTASLKAVAVECLGIYREILTKTVSLKLGVLGSRSRMPGVSELVLGVSGSTIGCPNFCLDNPDIYSEYIRVDDRMCGIVYSGRRLDVRTFIRSIRTYTGSLRAPLCLIVFKV